MSTWEERMSIRAAERASRRGTEEPPEPDMPAGHEGHHGHWRGPLSVCSCGEVWGTCSWVPDPRYRSDDPAERAQAEREEADWQAWISCHVCGEQGVTADDVSWPPRTLADARTLPARNGHE